MKENRAPLSSRKPAISPKNSQFSQQFFIMPKTHVSYPQAFKKVQFFPLKFPELLIKSGLKTRKFTKLIERKQKIVLFSRIYGMFRAKKLGKHQ